MNHEHQHPHDHRHPVRRPLHRNPLFGLAVVVMLVCIAVYVISGDLFGLFPKPAAPAPVPAPAGK